MAQQVIADLYGCDPALLNDEERISHISREVIKNIGAEVVEECVKKFEPIGITYFAIISTSHFSIHTWPEYGYLALDVFSCTDLVVDKVLAEIRRFFKPQELVIKNVERRIGRFEQV